HHDGVAGHQRPHQLVKLRAIRRRLARSLLAEYPLAACSPERINLSRIVLGLRAHPRIAVSHHILVLKIYFSESKRCDDSTSIKTFRITAREAARNLGKPRLPH